MSDTATKSRPEFRNVSLGRILSYHLPAAAKASILHRVSGALLFLAIPLIFLPLFAASVRSPQSYATVASWVANPLCKIVLLVLIWAYLHHFCAGIRFLILDLHIWGDEVRGQRSARIAFAVSLALTLVFGLKLVGAW